MSSAWNWLGIIVWLIIIAYFLFIIHNVHSRKKTLIKVAMNNRKHGLASNVAKNNFEITLFEVLILVVLLIGMGKATRHHHLTAANSFVTARYAPITESQTKLNMKKPNRKPHRYYVMIAKNKSRTFKQNYYYTVNGQKSKSSSTNSVIVHNQAQLKNDPNLSHLVQKTLQRKTIQRKLGRKQPAILQVVTSFKNSAANGIGLHAGQKKFYYTIIEVPGKAKHGIYVNTNKLKKKAKRVVPKG